MPYEVSDVPKSLLTQNQWVLSIDGTTYATFSQVSGLQRAVATNTRRDGGTGIQHTFAAPGATYTGGGASMTRQVDPLDANDARISNFVTQAIEKGTKFTGELTKYFQGEVLFRIRMYGLLFSSEQLPTFNKDATGIYAVTYNYTCDYWEQIGANE